MLGNFKTEIIGISAEIAVADVFGVKVDDSYRKRGRADIIEMTKSKVKALFDEKEVPYPLNIIAYNQNDVDFTLSDESTLSVKTNQKSLGKVAPQIIGQPTSVTYFNYFSKYINQEVPSSLEERRWLFKKFSLENPELVIEKYWDNLFHCDYLLYFYDFLDKNGNLKNAPKSFIISKLKPPVWDKSLFTFTQNINTWNESNTIKYNNITIGEFQVHSNRDCFKFRFNMKGILNITN